VHILAFSILCPYPFKTTIWQVFFHRKIWYKLLFTRSTDFSSKCTPKPFGGRAPPGPAGGAYSAPPDP